MRTLKRWIFNGAGNSVASTIDRWLHYVSLGFMWFGSGLLICIAFLTVADAFTRSLFSVPILGTIELVQLLLVCITFSGMVYATHIKGHVRVELIVTHLSSAAQNVFASIMLFIGAVIFGLVSWQLGLSAAEWASIGRHSATISLPVAPFKFVSAVAAGIICLLLLMSFVRTLSKQK